MDDGPRRNPRRSLRAVLRRQRSDPYAAVDLPNATRIGALIAIVVALIEAVALALGGVSDLASGVVAGAAIAVPALGGWWLFATGRTLDPTRLLLLPWLGLAQTALVGALVEDRMVVRVAVLWLLFAAAVHPPRRLAALGVATLAIALGLLAGRESTEAFVVDLLICAGLTVAAYVLMRALRVERLALRDGHARAVALSQLDPLTGLGNRRALDDALERETARSERSGSPFAVAVIDVDDFKAINDTFGHLEGDRCLREVARTIKETVRRPDVAFRWGGDEFVVLLPDAGSDSALQMLARLRDALHDAARTPDDRPVRASAAVASSEHASASEVLDAADRALLERKQGPSVRSA